MTSTHYDAIVIGGGAAGLSAAQALGRSLRKTLVIDAGAPRNRFAARMHNVLGHDGIPPLELLERGRAEARGYGVEFASGTVVAVRELADESGLSVDFRGSTPSESERAGSAESATVAAETAGTAGTAGTATVTAGILIVATGVSDTLPDVPGLAEYWGSSVLHCPYCHGWEVRGSRLAVLATSPMSLHQATLIRQWSEQFTVFSAEIGELDPAVAEALRARGTAIVPDPVIEVLGDGERVTGVRTADGVEHPIDAIFTMGTLTAHDGFLSELQLDRTDMPFGSFLAVDAAGRTSHPRIWAIGNIANPMATVPIAMGAGAMAGGAANFVLVEDDVAAALGAVRAA